MENIRLIIAGSRDFNDYDLLEKEADDYLLSIFIKLDTNLYEEFLIRLNIEDSCSDFPIEIVSGGARGADRLGEKYAEKRGLFIKRFIPNWSENGKGAGYIRNEEMAKYATDAIIFIFQSSKGSTHMSKIARKYNLGLKVINL